ncbi:hypothetical protein AAIB41_10390 [Brucella sp. BE17]|uniref:hypothetical protein n=1 Tax=Brucella sp. BE17 TaxID=3142977 RepID=UPI0031BB69F5
MKLTPKGKEAALGSPEEKADLYDKLLKGKEEDGGNIADYVYKGICYEAVAYVRYLKGGSISFEDIVTLSGDKWVPKLKFEDGQVWNGTMHLETGKAIGFKRVSPIQEFFHAGITSGGTYIRAINGKLLGEKWTKSINIVDVLGTRNPDGTFNFDRSKIKVYISPV